jgi:hypothetical protein
MSPSARKIADAWEGKKRKDGINERPTRKPPEPPKGQGVRTPDDPHYCSFLDALASPDT